MQSDLPLLVCKVTQPDGPVAYVTLTPQDQLSVRGIAPQEIVGQIIDPERPGIAPDNFARNRVFVEFLHGVIARHAPSLPALIAEAQRQGEGLVVIVDGRAETPQDAVPPEDIVGAFQIEGGRIVEDGYRPNPNHRILGARGFFCLVPELQQRLLEDLAASVAGEGA
ncbi:hypothetical protein J5226_19785 [Lysobacter sp. K5869]|uniref:hypothetical protein n=1 Tax=Lysobacter sp. K5869 TaxID=2820808 RepID=UPI001C061C65|nr:hypothetical protein [Lysobacter sp. K5869]QWP75827.1 hypothetical protein J5226_19785 [Lysobacter sp. K5869]